MEVGTRFGRVRWRRGNRSENIESVEASRPPATPGLQSIWVGSYRSLAEWHADAAGRDAMFSVMDSLDDKVLSSRHPFDVTAWCAVCEGVHPMAMAWFLSASNPEGSVNPAWTEIGHCTGCGLVSRQRAFVSLLRSLEIPISRSFIAERVTTSFDVLGGIVPGLVGAEFLGDDRTPGVEYEHGGTMVRHEDITSLTYPDDSFDLVMSQDVIEHVFDYPQAFRECRRVLRPGGAMVFTMPFAGRDQTRVLASVDATGEIEHHVLPPEIHGNPVGDGSLCFHHFGWDVLDTMREAGFTDSVAHQYWAPWAGHIGYPTFVFEAR